MGLFINGRLACLTLLLHLNTLNWGQRNGQGCESKHRVSQTDTDKERSPEENILFGGREETGQPPLSIPLQAFVLQPLHLAKDANDG